MMVKMEMGRVGLAHCQLTDNAAAPPPPGGRGCPMSITYHDRFYIPYPLFGRFVREGAAGLRDHLGGTAPLRVHGDSDRPSSHATYIPQGQVQSCLHVLYSS
jgi:hypothetical protein